jgi:ribosomal protein S18 acetylase RimI-like enzyme
MTVALRHAESDADIRACFSVMRALRPHHRSADELLARVREQAAESYRILAAWQDGGVCGLAGYRRQHNLIRGAFCYVDDLVVAETARRSGLGARLLDAVAAEARAQSIGVMVLDTNLENGLGQRFYFRYGMLPAALRFAKPIA